MSKGRWFALAAFALLLLARPSLAQRVVILEFDGDRQERLRAQVEAALAAAAVVEVVPIAQYKDVAARKRIRGSSAMTPAAVGKIAPALGVDAAVEGALGETFLVRILDFSGQELWSKELPLKGGLISADHAKKLAKAVAAAAKTAPRAAAGGEPSPGRSGKKRGSSAANMPGIDLSSEDPETPGEVDDADLENEMRRPKVRGGPKLITATLVGSTTWRAYCSRPGVKSCREYDAIDPATQPRGDTVDFMSGVPYIGATLRLELFPLASFDGLVNGLGLLGQFGLGWSVTNVKVRSPDGETPSKEVFSTDTGIRAGAAYRYHFSYGDRRDPLIGYAGLHGGYEVRTFEVDPTAQVPLPGSHRGYPVLGIDASVPLAKMLRIELSGSYLLSPRAGADEIAGYGDPAAFDAGASGRGFSVEVGFAGELYGPVGYSVRFKLLSFSDQFYGQGQKWPCDDAQCGGAAEETYSGLTWGVSAAF